jgi:hypothetical protein
MCASAVACQNRCTCSSRRSGAGNRPGASPRWNPSPDLNNPLRNRRSLRMSGFGRGDLGAGEDPGRGGRLSAVPVQQLPREIRELGYQGSSNLLVRYLTQGRTEGDRLHLSPRRAARLCSPGIRNAVQPIPVQQTGPRHCHPAVLGIAAVTGQPVNIITGT